MPAKYECDCGCGESALASDGVTLDPIGWLRVEHIGVQTMGDPRHWIVKDWRHLGILAAKKIEGR